MGTARRFRQDNPDIGLYGLLPAPVRWRCIFWEPAIFMKMFDEPEYIKRLMDDCTKVGIRMAAFMDAGCDVIAVVDSMTSQVGPEQFREYVTPHMTEVFRHIKERGGAQFIFVATMVPPGEVLFRSSLNMSPLPGFVWVAPICSGVNMVKT